VIMISYLETDLLTVGRRYRQPDAVVRFWDETYQKEFPHGLVGLGHGLVEDKGNLGTNLY
jgi:hypothetical protein